MIINNLKVIDLRIDNKNKISDTDSLSININKIKDTDNSINIKNTNTSNYDYSNDHLYVEREYERNWGKVKKPDSFQTDKQIIIKNKENTSNKANKVEDQDNKDKENKNYFYETSSIISKKMTIIIQPK